MQTMIDPTVLALCVAFGALVLAFGVAGALRRHGRNAEAVMADLAARLLTEFWSERRLGADIEEAIGRWSPKNRANLRRLIKTGETDDSFRSVIDTVPAMQATLDKIFASEAAIQPKKPDTACNSPDDQKSLRHVTEYIVSISNKARRTLEAFKGLIAYVVEDSGKVSIGTVTNFRFYSIPSENNRRFVPEVLVDAFEGRNRPADLCNGSVWREITKVYWTEEDACRAVNRRANAVKSAADAVFAGRKGGDDNAVA